MMTIEEITTRKECQTFDRKCIQIDPKALAICVLSDLNLIKYVGSNKTGHWEVKQ